MWDMTPRQVKEKEQCSFEKSNSFDYDGVFKGYLKDEEIDEYICSKVKLGNEYESQMIKYHFIDNKLKEVIYVFDWKVGEDSNAISYQDWRENVFGLDNILKAKYGHSTSSSESYATEVGYSFGIGGKTLHMGDLISLSRQWYTKSKRTDIKYAADFKSGITIIVYSNKLFKDILVKNREAEEKKKTEDAAKEF